MSGKLSVGVYRDTSVDGEWAINELVALDARAIFLAFGALGMARALKDRQSGITIVGRPDIPEAQLGDVIAGGRDMGYSWGLRCCQWWPDVDVWAPICEYVPGAAPDRQWEKDEQYRRLQAQAAWELGFMDACKKYNKNVVCGNIASGILPLPEFADQCDQWAPIIKPLTGHAAYHSWGVHLYGTPESVAPGSRGRMMAPPSPYFALRHEGFDQAMLARGVDVRQFAATEFGCTDGWQGFIGMDELLIDCLSWADRVCASDRFWSAFYFLCGTDYPGDQDKWKRFDVQGAGACARFGAWNKEHPVGEIVPPVEEEPMPTMFHLGTIDIVDLRGALPVHSAVKYNTRLLGAIKRLVIHHSATGPTATAEAMARYHVDHNGWPGIGYHFVVTASGEIQYTNDHALITYGVAGQNADTVHICLVGDFTNTAPPDAQLAGAKRLIDNYRLAMGQNYPVVGHRDIAQSECPGATWGQWKARLTQDEAVDWEAKFRTLMAEYAAQEQRLVALQAKLQAAREALA